MQRTGWQTPKLWISFRNVVESCPAAKDIERVIALTDPLDAVADTIELFELLVTTRYVSSQMSVK